MRFLAGGPPGMMLLLIGLVLAAGSAWQAVGSPNWRGYVPALLIGLSLMSFGYSIVKRDQRARKKASRW
jgi:TRAP-type C4-dicarboxylate transport system permease large subunit